MHKMLSLYTYVGKDHYILQLFTCNISDVYKCNTWYKTHVFLSIHKIIYMYLPSADISVSDESINRISSTQALQLFNMPKVHIAHVLALLHISVGQNYGEKKEKI